MPTEPLFVGGTGFAQYNKQIYAGEVCPFWSTLFETPTSYEEKPSMKKIFVLMQCSLPTIQVTGWSILCGVMGTLILAGFFSGIMSLETLSSLIPLIVGGNAAISGYMLIERTEDEITRKKTMAAAVGMAVAIFSCVSINALCFKIGIFFLMPGYQSLAATAIGILGGLSGGVLAVKYRELKEQASSV
jgi:hypothetical protein